MIKIKRLFLESPPASLHIIGAIYLLPSLLLYFVSEDLKFALLLEGYSFLESLKNIWFPSAEFLNEGGLFRPIVSTINLIDYSLWGTNAFGYHLTNAVVHLVNIQLVYHFSFRLFKRVDISFLCSVIFLLHPILANSVYWISGRTDMVACSFYLTSLMMADKYLRGMDVKYFILSQASFLAALLSKEISVTLPLAQVWLILYHRCTLERDIRLKPIITRFISSSAFVVALFLIYRLIIFDKNPFMIDDIYNIGGIYHYFINAIKAASFLAIPFGHHNFEAMVYEYKLYLLVITIPIGIRFIMLAIQKRKELGQEIALFTLLLISVLPLFKLAMRWYMYIPAVFFAMFIANIICNLWGRGNVSKALISIYLGLNIIGDLNNYNVWLDNSRINRTLVSQVVEYIENENKADTFVILNFPAKINRTATFVAGFEELIYLKLKEKDKKIIRPVNINHQLDMFPTAINYERGRFTINACESSSHCLLGSDRQRLRLSKLSPGDMIKTSVGDIFIEKTNQAGQAIRVLLVMDEKYLNDNTQYLFFDEKDELLKQYLFYNNIDI